MARIAQKILEIGTKCGRWTLKKRSEKSRYWLCQCDCGKQRDVYDGSLRSGASVSCGCFAVEFLESRVGAKHPQWKGGRHWKPDGYVVLWDSHRKRMVYEHVRVLSQHLGRPLVKGETVHHKNGIRNDNRIENLELRVSNHGKGQSPQDVVVWAVEVLKRYAPEKLAK